MIHETYKGRKLKVVKGHEYGYARAFVNGVALGRQMGTEVDALKWMKAAIDSVDEVGVGSGRYGAEWYAPGTFELCDEGHAKEIGGECGHEWCVKQRPATAVDAKPAVEEVASVDASAIAAEFNIPVSDVLTIADRLAGVAGSSGVLNADRGHEVTILEGAAIIIREQLVAYLEGIPVRAADLRRGDTFDRHGHAWTVEYVGRTGYANRPNSVIVADRGTVWVPLNHVLEHVRRPIA